MASYLHFAELPILRSTSNISAGATISNPKVDAEGYDELRVFVFMDQPGRVRVLQSGGGNTRRLTTELLVVASTALVQTVRVDGKLLEVQVVNDGAGATTAVDIRMTLRRER